MLAGVLLPFLFWLAIQAVDRDSFRAALTQPLFIVKIKPGEEPGIECICDRTLRADEIPDHVIDALIATEDRRFHSHIGFDPRGMARAARSGFREGGSTLTQQLAKRTFTGSDRDLARKMFELFYALRIEALFGKDDILRLYLSRVNFGNDGGNPINGLRAAARAYFGKAPQSLTLAEGALLVGMLKAPTTYHLMDNRERAIARAETVVRLMKDTGAPAEPTAVDLKSAAPRAWQARPIRHRFLEDLAKAEFLALSPNPAPGTYRLVSSIDPIAQYQARRVVEAEIARRPKDRVAQAALMTLGPEGRILAMLGGRNYRLSTFNVAMRGDRQAASTAKIATYLAALDNGWEPDWRVYDDPDRLTGPVKPRNSDGRYIGATRLDTCIAQSRNVCTMYIAETIGMASVSAMSARLGLTPEGTPGRSIVLGAAETTLARNTAAFAAISGDGQVVDPRMLRLVLKRNGLIAHRQSPPKGPAVTNDDVLAKMRGLLAGVVGGGTGANAALAETVVHGKTGTSQNNRDAWFVGFIGEGITTGIWVGPVEGGTMANVAGGDLPARIFARYNRNLLERFQDHAAGTFPLSR